MKCIMCGEELRFKAGQAPLWNVDQYGNPANAKTACCNKMLRIFPRRSFDFVHMQNLDNSEDDWGRN